MLLPSVLRVFRGGTRGAGQPKAPSRILLVKQSERMGNIILMNTGIAGLREAFPEARIDLLLPASYAAIMRANDNINEIISVKKKKYITKPWGLLGLLSNLKGRAYDLAINCSDVNSHSSTEAAYTILSGAERTAGWKIGRGVLFDIEVERYGETLHATQMYVKLFSGIFGRRIEGEPFFTRAGNSSSAAEPTIGINCGGRGSKRISIEQFLALGNRLAHSGARIEFILGPDESSLRKDVEAQLPNGCHLLPPMKLTELMTAIKRHRVFVSSDTGPMHLAWTLGIPTVAIFIDSEIEKFRPLSPGSLAIDGAGGIDLECIYGHVLKILNPTKASR